MKTKEILIEVNNLQKKSNDLSKIVKNAIYKYLDEIIGIGSTNSSASDDLIGKVADTEWSWYWNKTKNLITISFCVFRNRWGDLSDENEIDVDFSDIDKYIEI